MIKICHISNHITGKSDGVYSHLKMIFHNSDKEKFQHYLIFQGGEKIEKELPEIGIEYFISKSLKKKISIKAFWDIYKFIKENNISVIHTHMVKPYAIAGLINIFLRRKFIYNYHGLFISKNVYYGIIEKFIYKIFHLIINLFKVVNVVLVPSRRSSELLLAETKLFPKADVYYNGYEMNKNSCPDINLLNRIKEIKKDSFIIAVVSRLERQKKIDRAIELFAEINLQRENTKLLIFGEGEMEETLMEQVKQIDAGSNIIFFGYVENITAYFNLFDIILFTSEWEGMPLVMWEAMGNNVPVVAPDVGGFKEIFEENKCGIIYNPQNLSEAKDKIIMLIDNNDLIKKLGQNGQESVKTKYNSWEFNRTIEKIYTDLVS